MFDNFSMHVMMITELCVHAAYTIAALQNFTHGRANQSHLER